MRKVLVLLLALLVGSCGSNNYGGFATPADPTWADDTAREIMKSTVKIQVLALGESFDGEVALIGWSGSGAVVAVNYANEESLILTAKHVCEVPTYIPTRTRGVLKTLIHHTAIQTATGSVYNAEALVMDQMSDTCVILVYGVAGKPARIANEMPPLQGHVMMPGAPLGEMMPNMVPITDGRYSGVVPYVTDMGDVRQMAFALPGTFGNSGSGIYYNGEIVSVLSQGVPDYHHLTYGPHLSRIRFTVK